MAILGYNTKGSLNTVFTADIAYVSKFTLASAGTLNELHGWFGGSGTNVKVLIYSDTGANYPNALLAATSGLALTGADVELSQSGFSVALAAGVYWIGWVPQAAGTGGKAYRDDIGAHKAGSTVGYASPANPFPGGASSGSRQFSCWAVVGAATTSHTRSIGDTVALTDTATPTLVEPPAVIEGFSIAFDADTLDPDPDWTRIDTLAGCRVRGWSIDRGRPTEFDKTDVGTAVVNIVDRAGLFDPTNATSPYVGQIVPGKQAAIALQNPIGDAWHTLFRGFIESWHYRLDQTEQFMELELQLVDGFAILARVELEVGVDGALPPFDDFPAEQATALGELAAGNVLYGETTGTLSDRIYAILATNTAHEHWPEELAEPVVDVFTGNVNVGPKAYGPGTSALDALWDCVDAEFPGVANLYMSRDGHLTFHGRQARFRPDVAEYGITKYTVGDPSATPVDDEDVVPVSELEWSSGQDNLFNACSATPQWIGTGATIRQLDPGPPHNDNVAGQYVKNQASIDAYGLRSLTFDNLQTVEGIATGNNSMQETRRVAVFYVENYKEPAPRISRLVFKTRRPGDAKGPALWQFLCNVEISDLLRLRTAHPGSGGFDTEVYVEGIHYTARPGPPEYPIVELSIDASPRAHYTTNPYDEDTDPA